MNFHIFSAFFATKERRHIMKRIKSACLYQTVSFLLDPNVTRGEAIKKIESEISNYKAKAGSSLQILKERKNDDGSIELEVRKKVHPYSIGNYFD